MLLYLFCIFLKKKQRPLVIAIWVCKDKTWQGLTPGTCPWESVASACAAAMSQLSIGRTEIHMHMLAGAEPWPYTRPGWLRGRRVDDPTEPEPELEPVFFLPKAERRRKEQHMQLGLFRHWASSAQWAGSRSPLPGIPHQTFPAAFFNRTLSVLQINTFFYCYDSCLTIHLI